MEGIGINSNVFAGGKMFHIQTAGNYGHLSVKSEIWETGRVIYVERTKMESLTGNPITKEEFADFMNSFHQEVGWELELLFMIRDKVHSIKHAVSYNKMGHVFLIRGLPDEALEEFHLALEYQPDMIEAIKNIGLAYIQKKEYTEALRNLTKAADMAPNYPDIKYFIALAHYHLKNYLESYRILQEALNLNPKYADALHLISQVLCESVLHDPDQTDLGPLSVRKKKATAYLESFLSLQPTSELDPALHHKGKQAIREIQEDQIAQTLKSLNELREMSRKISAEDMMNTFYLKFLFGGAGKDEKILYKYQQQLEKSIAQNPDYADVHNTLGLVYLVQCRNLFLKAASQFKKASDINPSFKAAYRNYRLVQNDGREFLNLLRAILK